MKISCCLLRMLVVLVVFAIFGTLGVSALTAEELPHREEVAVRVTVRTALSNGYYLPAGESITLECGTQITLPADIGFDLMILDVRQEREALSFVSEKLGEDEKVLFAWYLLPLGQGIDDGEAAMKLPTVLPGSIDLDRIYAITDRVLSDAAFITEGDTVYLSLPEASYLVYAGTIGEQPAPPTGERVTFFIFFIALGGLSAVGALGIKNKMRNLSV